jgi:ParB family chromosome partitioning protein
MRKRVLGRGIEALISKGEQEAVQEGFRLIPLADIRPNPFQPRSDFSESELEDLAASIRQKGVLEPIIVKRDKNVFVLAAGERRFRAARLAGLKDIPAIIRDLSDRELLEIGIVENLLRRDLNPVEEAIGYEQLIKNFGLTHDQVAQLVNRERSTVTNLLRLLTLPEKVKTYLREGKIGEGHARALLGLDSEIKILQVCTRVVREGLSVRATENLIKRMQKKPAIRPGPEKEPNLLILEDELSKLFRTRVTVDWKRNKGQVIIHCLSLEDFNRIYDLLRRIRR